MYILYLYNICLHVIHTYTYIYKCTTIANTHHNGLCTFNPTTSAAKNSLQPK